jgi:hypothetical protein
MELEMHSMLIVREKLLSKKRMAKGMVLNGRRHAFQESRQRSAIQSSPAIMARCDGTVKHTCLCDVLDTKLRPKRSF